jgi:anionic cell wall polymer biosynthesis LytR-Cps2A-Psr (LCP) family protein
MGGLTMTFDDPVVDRGRTIIDHAGTQVITGEQALALVRARHEAGDPTADLGRIGRQQQVLRAMPAQATTRHLVSAPAGLNAALQSIIDNSVTDNVTVQELLDLALSVKGDGSAAVHEYTLPTVPDTGTDGLRAAGTMSSYLRC